MHHLTALSLKNRALIALVTIVAAVFGLLGVGSLKQELMPSVQFPAIAVVTSYPGASPEVVNKEVSGPIETALRGVPQLESSNATSSTGASMVLAQFTYGVDIAATEQKVERAVSRISQLLPAAADTQVMSGSIDDFPVIQIAVTPTEGQTPEQAAEVVERIAIADLSDLDGVRDAQLSGARPDRITIVPNFEALGAQGLGAQSITDTLQQSGVLVAAGSITEGDQTLSVQAGSTVTSAEDIAALPLPVSAEQIMAQQEELARQQAPVRPGVQPEVQPAPVLTPITIGDVAEVRLEPGPVESISRVNGAPALTIAVTKTSAANTVEVSHAVQDQLAELEDQLGGVELSVVFDQAPYVEDSIETLTTEGLLGLLFAVLVILVFLMSVRATLVTAISIPTSVLLTFIGLNFADYTLNMLTLGALTISIGRVVDDSIVVVENIKRHLVSDTDRAATITMAVREVAGAITASTITTVAVFLPMAFVAGMVGELFRPFAFTVTIALVASLLVSLTIVPVLAYWFLKPEHARRRETAVGEAVAQPTRLQRWYHPVIDWTLRRPAVTLMIAALVFGGTIAASPLMKTNFMGADEQNSVGLVQTLTPGTSLDAQLAQAERVEGVLADLPEVETVQVTIGSSGGGMAAIFGGGGDGAVNYSLTTDPKVNQEQAQDAIRSAVNGLDNAGEFSLGQSGGGVTMSSAIEVVVSAPDQETLATASGAVLAELREQDGLKQVESDLALSRPYLAITVDRAAAAAAGLTEAGVAGQVAQQMQPNQIGQITLNSATTSVYLADTVAPTDQAGVAALPIQTAVGPQALSALATVAVADGPVTIRTEDTARVVTISALPEGDDLTAASAAVNRALDAVELPAGANASIGGVMSQQSEAFGQLGLALLAAILIVYVVMVATFRSLLQPLLLLISVPFAATGAILLLIVTGIPLGVASLIGVLMLIGIVVTNAIVLIDLVNQYRDRGEPLKQAVTHGSLQRLRPIVMTALATILALTPMALGITGKGGFISQPLAVVVIGGLLSSTVLTLVVLPTLYYAVERRREGRNRPRDPGTAREPKSPRGPLRRRGAARAAATAGVASPDGLVLAGSGVAGTAALTNAGHADAADVVDAAHADIAGTNAPTLNVEPQPVSVAEPASEVEPSDEPGSEAEPFAEPELVAEPLAEPELVAESVPAPVAAPVSAPVPIVLPEPPTGPPAPEAPEPVAVSLPEAPAEAPGPNTQQMSLDLEDLGFVGADNPIEARLSGTVPVEAPVEDQPAEPEPSAPSVPEPEVTAAPIEAEAATMEADTTAFTPEVFDFTDEQPVEEQLDDTTQIDAVPAQMPDAPAPPVTGELNWEQLLWQATQEIDEEVAADSSATGESAAADPAKNEGGAHGVAPDDNER